MLQAGSAIPDNYDRLLSHRQKMSDDGQKIFRHIKIDKMKRCVQGIGVKMIRRGHTEKRTFRPRPLTLTQSQWI